MFLMYKPNATDAMFVPLLVVNWYWMGKAQSADGRDWEVVVGSTGNSINPVFTATTVFPEWDKFMKDAGT